MSEWQTTKLGDVLTLNYGKALKAENRVFGEIPVYSSAGLTGYHNEPLVESHGLIVGRKGTVGKVYYSKVPFCCIDTAYYVLPNEAKYSLDYFYYLLQSLGLEELNEDSAVPGLNRETAYQQEFLLPSVPEQKAIASVLSSLDDKIDLLHRQNTTLEAMAETLFRKWFVEEAQENWEEVKLGDFFPVVTGKKDANFSTDDGYYPFFTCSQTAIRAPNFSFDAAAILLAGNGDFNVKRYVGKFEAYQRTYVLIPDEIKYFNFLFVLMKYYLSDITGGHQGSVISFITKGMITDFTFSMPKQREMLSGRLKQFDELYEKIDSNTNQIQTLEKLRDTLLPKLISGEVSVLN